MRVTAPALDTNNIRYWTPRAGIGGSHVRICRYASFVAQHASPSAGVYYWQSVYQTYRRGCDVNLGY
jgi:hypothetical protein